MKPTPEQIAAAKAWTKCDESSRQHALLLGSHEQAMKQARWAIALQLRRWRDGDEVCAVTELQNAHDALVDLVGEAKMQERVNPRAALKAP